MKRLIPSVFGAACFFALMSSAAAEKTAVIPCIKTSDRTIKFEENDFDRLAEMFAISDPRFYKIDQFRRLKGPDSEGNIRGSCIISFMSEDEFNMYYRN